jgi:hypothetical protein
VKQINKKGERERGKLKPESERKQREMNTYKKR